MDAPLRQSFYDRDVVIVARELVGKTLHRHTPDGYVSGRIVEVEAYLAANDSACHSARGRTRRNASMFGPPGRAYVYAIHSRWCFNVVTDKETVASAVLIRAIEPREGIPLMVQRRGCEKLFDLARGPGRLCEALAIDRHLDGWDLTRGQELWISRGYRRRSTENVVASPRIGVTSAHDLLLRFFIHGSRFVSGPRNLHGNAPTS